MNNIKLFILLSIFAIAPAFSSFISAPESDPEAIHRDGTVGPLANINWNGFAITNASDIVLTSAATFADLGVAPSNPAASNFKVYFRSGLPYYRNSSGTESSFGGGITGPGSSTHNALARWNGAGGTALNNSLASVDDTGIMNSVGLTLSGLTASRALQTDASKNLESSSVTTTELGYVSGVTSAIQTQLNAKASASGSANQVAYFTGASALASDSDFTFDGTFITHTGTATNSSPNVHLITAATSGTQSVRTSGLNVDMTPGGTINDVNSAMTFRVNAGTPTYGASGSTWALNASNAGGSGASGNSIAIESFTSAAGTPHGIGIRGGANGGTSDTIGVVGYSIGSAINYGVAAFASGGTSNVAGFFGLGSQPTTMPSQSAALVASNGSAAFDVVKFQDNGTDVWKIVDGGDQVAVGAMDLYWNTDGGGNIGSPDGGATSKRPDMAFIKTELDVGDSGNQVSIKSGTLETGALRRIDVTASIDGANVTGGLDGGGEKISLDTSGTFPSGNSHTGLRVNLFGSGTSTNGSWGTTLSLGNTAELSGTTFDGSGDQVTDGYSTAIETDSSGTGPINVGGIFQARSSTSLDAGIVGQATRGDAGTRHYAVLGYADNSTATNVAGYFVLDSMGDLPSQLPPVQSAAIVADNSGQAFDIAKFQDNHVDKLRIKDSGLVDHTITIDAGQIGTLQTVTSTNSSNNIAHEIHITNTSGTGGDYGLYVLNDSTSGGTHQGITVDSIGASSGNSYGISAGAEGGVINLAMRAHGISDSASENSFGIAAAGYNSNSSGQMVGGYFSLNAGGAFSPGNITTTIQGSAALIANNFTTTKDIFKGQDNAVDVFRILDGGQIGTNQSVANTNTPSGATSRALAIYNESGTLLGYIPVYAAQW